VIAAADVKLEWMYKPEETNSHKPLLAYYYDYTYTIKERKWEDDEI
jgi:hypothetical protein